MSLWGKKYICNFHLGKGLFAFYINKWWGPVPTIMFILWGRQITFRPRNIDPLWSTKTKTEFCLCFNIQISPRFFPAKPGIQAIPTLSLKKNPENRKKSAEILRNPGKSWEICPPQPWTRCNIFWFKNADFRNIGMFWKKIIRFLSEMCNILVKKCLFSQNLHIFNRKFRFLF